MEPRGSQIWFAVDTEIDAFDGIPISKQVRAVTGAQADFNIWKLFDRFVFGWQSLFSLFL